MAGRTALLVIDVQPVFMNPDSMLTLDGDDLVAKCRTLIERARAEGIPVIYVQHVDEDDMPKDVSPEAKAIHSDIAPTLGEPIVEKIFGSAFMQTKLEEVLTSKEITHLVVCGLSAYGCVNQTVLHARLFNYDVTVAEDAVGAPDHPGFPAQEGIAAFADEWTKAGMKLVKTADLRFQET
ncbi:TPA: hypothetical protein DIT45_03795 [Candidatus Acetothermia bacterium]|nr:hypothetical protein [Candidatus Acetothermia bacterium]